MLRKLNKSEKYLIKIIRECPPIDQIEKNIIFKLTPDQIEYYRNEKYYWSLIGLGLKAYFSGESIKIVLKNELKGEVHNYLLLDIDRWLKFYDLINFGWSDIVNYFKIKDCPLRFNNPGEAIQFILWCESLCYLVNCLRPLYEYCPQKSHRTIRSIRKIRGKKIINEPLNTSEKKLLTTLDRNIKLDPYKDFLFGEVFEGIFVTLLSKSKCKLVRKKLKLYECADSELEDEKLKQTHPSIRQNGFSFVKGKKKIGKKGGYA